jgi:hypothetical protein
MRSHQNLATWLKALDLVTDVYKGTECFPKEEPVWAN